VEKRNSAGAAAGQDTFIISRVFDAPRDLVFRVWTDPKHLAKWWGPKGVTIVSCANDLRPGGLFHYCMRWPDGQEMWGKWVYREIAVPERLVFLNCFSDPEGRTTRAPFFDGTWPLETLTTITFAEHLGKTTVTVEWIPLDATEAERRTFADNHDSMRAGWGGTMDQLAAYLSTI
jgi:uncharacterized protein YndB with AHSA1/START domain